MAANESRWKLSVYMGRILRLKGAAIRLRTCVESLATLVVPKQGRFYSMGCDVSSIEATTPPALPL